MVAASAGHLVRASCSRRTWQRASHAKAAVGPFQFFSHSVHPNHGFPSLHSSQSPQPPVSPWSTPPPFPFGKGRVSKRQQQNRAKQDTIRQGKTPHGHWTRQRSSRRGVLRTARGETHSFLQPGFPQKHQASSSNVCTAELVQSHVGPMLAASWASFTWTHVSPA